MTASTDRPKFSVVIPTYNRRDELAEAIRSVFAQTVTDEVEVVVSDNCSTDGTDDLLRQPEFAGVRLVRQSANVGRWRNMSTALASSRGTYVTMLFADEVMEPANLELKAKILDRDPSLAAVHSNWLIRRADGSTSPHVPIRDRLVVENPKQFRRRAFRQTPGWICTLLMRGDTARKLVVRESDAPSDDDAFFLRLSNHGSLAYMPDALVTQTWNAGDSVKTGYVDVKDGVAASGLWFAWAQRRIRDEYLVVNADELGPAEVFLLDKLCRLKYRRDVWTTALARWRFGFGVRDAAAVVRTAVALDATVAVPPLIALVRDGLLGHTWRTKV